MFSGGFRSTPLLEAMEADLLHWCPSQSSSLSPRCSDGSSEQAFYNPSPTIVQGSVGCTSSPTARERLEAVLDVLESDNADKHGGHQAAVLASGKAGVSPAGSGACSPASGTRWRPASPQASPLASLAASNAASPPGSPVRPRKEAAAARGASLVISLWEENDLLSPTGIPLSRGLEEEPGQAASQSPPCRRARSVSPAREREVEIAGKARQPSPRRGDGAPNTVASEGAGAGLAPGAEPEGARRALTPTRRADRQPLRTPLLWDGRELAAFAVCLGMSPDACRRIRQRRLRGAAHLLDFSNTQLRRDLGLSCPVERLVVRQSLRRLLDADRWENMRGHKVGDLASDSVLSRCMVPAQELTLVTKISQGGYGTVYRGMLEPSADRGACRPNKSHLVAVKEMKGERRIRMYELLKEARVMASLNHPNVCAFIGVCVDDAATKHYIISELLDCSLFDLVHQPYKIHWHGDLSALVVIHVSIGICAGISYLHAKNLVHADLKSSNILVDYSTSWQLTPRICDFGHAAVRSFPTPHHRCGTPHWAAPEVLRSEALGPQADIYSFGVIVWEMLAQKLPHRGLSFGQVLGCVGWAGWTPDLALLPEVPPELRRLLRRCLSFLPGERPSGRQLQRRLRRIPRKAREQAARALAAFLN